MPESLHEHIAASRQALVDAGFNPEDAALDVEVLARHVLGWELARLLAHAREPAPPEFGQRLQSAVSRRARHEPVAFITGHREFWGLDFEVTRATMVPRPETELIVEAALEVLPADRPATVVDIGTGSGCLALAIATERPSVRVIATDISHDALLVAQRNAATHRVAHQIRFVRADLATPLLIRAELVVSNPPYVPDASRASLPPDVVGYEPSVALFAGSDGLWVIRRLLEGTRHQLAHDGVFVVEFGYGQENDVRNLALKWGWQVSKVLHDLQGIARTMVLRRQSG